jgi:MFS family permease
MGADQDPTSSDPAGGDAGGGAGAGEDAAGDAAGDAGGGDAGGVGSRGYRWYVTAQIVSIVGTMMGYTALYWLALRLGHGNAAVLSAVAAAETLPMLVFSRRAGNIVARHRAVRIVIVTQALQAAGSLAIGIPLLAGRMTIWYLVPLAFVIGCVQTVDVPARQTFMLDLVGRARRPRGPAREAPHAPRGRPTSLYATITGLAKIAGPGVAGVIIAVTGESAVFLLDAASFLGVIAVLALVSGEVHRAPPPVAAAATRRLRWVLDLPPAVQAVAAMALLLGGFGLQFAVTNPLMATKIFHLGAVGFGLLGTFMAVGGIAGSYYSSRRPDPGPSEFLRWALVFGLAECLAAIMPTVWGYDLAMVVIGGATQLFAVSATVYVQQATPPAQRAHALSAYNAAFIGFVPAGAFVVAGLAAVAGIRWALIGPGLLVAAGAAGILTARRLRPGALLSRRAGWR